MYIICIKYVPLQLKEENIPSLLSKTMVANYYEIKLARFNEGWTQAQLAQRAKISLSVVIKAERGKSISPRSNYAIRQALRLK